MPLLSDYRNRVVKGVHRRQTGDTSRKVFQRTPIRRLHWIEAFMSIAEYSRHHRMPHIRSHAGRIADASGSFPYLACADRFIEVVTVYIPERNDRYRHRDIVLSGGRRTHTTPCVEHEPQWGISSVGDEFLRCGRFCHRSSPTFR